MAQDFYVGARNGSRTVATKGPFTTRDEASSHVSSERDRVAKQDSWAVFYTWGVIAVPSGTHVVLGGASCAS